MGSDLHIETSQKLMIPCKQLVLRLNIDVHHRHPVCEDRMPDFFRYYPNDESIVQRYDSKVWLLMSVSNFFFMRCFLTATEEGAMP